MIRNSGYRYPYSAFKLTICLTAKCPKWYNIGEKEKEKERRYFAKYQNIIHPGQLIMMIMSDNENNKIKI